MDNKQEKKLYIEMDIVGLSEILAEDAWEEIVGKNPDTDLYETVTNESGETVRQVVPHWVHEYFAMKKCYLNLLNSYAKNPMKEHEIEQL